MDTTMNGDNTTSHSLDNNLEIKEVDDKVEFPCLSQGRSEDISETNCNSSEFTENSLSFGKLSDGEEFQDATQFFQNEPQLEYLETITTSNHNSWLTRNSLGRNFDPLFQTYGRPSDLSPVVESETVCKIIPASLPDLIETVSTKVESFDLKEDTSNNIVDRKLSFVKGPILIPSRESLGNLIKLDSPEKKCPVDYFDFVNPSTTSNPVLYNEEELNKLLKLQELQFAEVYLRKQRDLELEETKLLNEKDNIIQLLNQIASSLHLVLQNLTILVQNQNEQKEILKMKVQNLMNENEDLKSVSQNFAITENKLSCVHKCYDLAKELLETYKSNEDKLLKQVEALREQLVSLEEQNKSLLSQFEEMVAANAEDPKSTVDAQLTVCQALLQKSNLKEEYLENQLKQVKDENCKLKNIIEDLTAKIGGI